MDEVTTLIFMLDTDHRAIPLPPLTHTPLYIKYAAHILCNFTPLTLRHSLHLHRQVAVCNLASIVLPKFVSKRTTLAPTAVNGADAASSTTLPLPLPLHCEMYHITDELETITAESPPTTSHQVLQQQPPQQQLQQHQQQQPQQQGGYLFDHDRLYEVTKVITRNLNKIIDTNYYPVEEVVLLTHGTDTVTITIIATVTVTITITITLPQITAHTTCKNPPLPLPSLLFFPSSFSSSTRPATPTCVIVLLELVCKVWLTRFKRCDYPLTGEGDHTTDH